MQDGKVQGAPKLEIDVFGASRVIRESENLPHYRWREYVSFEGEGRVF